MVLCPECESDLDLDEDELEEGDTVSCSECGTDLEVVTAEPLVLAPVSEDADEEKEGDTAVEEEEE